ncbi:hypothetical protein CROQUDRAFT_51438 [Cronartium quercuum f. sp. fusiforme G11]|uniref:Sfi1 spindle body domain-containing protein n=1 Tax=Cronartium quercuum f. sp. fusiforme G11 TaxID=708437 RepID=A0A9P6N9Q6_9BASI|nr:hypothetical protein CROQUDRAFT_51438 [Cronartium quercuum f. sp. fusiforme G11]
MDALKILSAKSSASGPSQFPVLPRVEFDVLAQILAITPANTTTFNALLGPYHEVLKQHGIDHRTDERIYTLLLKLSLVPGTDWRQKWHRVTEEHRAEHATEDDDEVSPPLRALRTETSEDVDAIKRSRAIASAAGFVETPMSRKHSRNHDTNRLFEEPRKPDHEGRQIMPSISPHEYTRVPRRKSVHFSPSSLHEVGRLKHISILDPTVSPQLLTNSPHLVDRFGLLASRWRRQQILRRTLFCWKRNMDRWRKVGDEVQRVRILLDTSVYYERWKRKERHIAMQFRTVDRVHRIRLLLASLHHWRHLTIRRHDARWLVFRLQACEEVQNRINHSLIRWVLIKLRNAASVVSALRDHNTLLLIIRHWVVAERGLFAQKIRAARHQRVCLQLWRDRLKRIHIQLETVHIEYVHNNHTKSLRNQWFIWVQRFREIIYASRLASERDRVNMIQRGLKAMKTCYARIQEDHHRADLIRIRLTKQTIINIWRKRTRKKQVTRWSRTRKQRRLQTWFQMWCDMCKKRKYEAIALQKLHAISTLRIYRTTLTTWSSLWRLHIHWDFEAAETFRINLTHSYLITWVTQNQSQLAARLRADAFTMRCDYAAKRRLLAYWFSLTRHIQDGNSKLKRYLHNQRMRLLQHVWDRWQDTMCERLLNHKENFARTATEHNCKLRTLRNWISRSLSLSTLRRSRENDARFYLHIWRSSARRKANGLLAMELDYQKTLRSHFTTWLQKSLDIKASKMMK